MKRSALKRTTPLARGTSELKRAPLTTDRKALPKRGKKVKADERAIARSAPAARRRSGGVCEFHVRGVCTQRAVHLHHRKRREFGDHGSKNLVDLCLECHAYVHAHPNESYEKGWLILSTGDPTEIEWMRER